MIDTTQTSKHPYEEIRPKIEEESLNQSESNSSKAALEKIFASSDFSKFLSREYPDTFKENNSLFLSNDLSLPGLDAMMFKSRETSLGSLGMGLYGLNSMEWPSATTQPSSGGLLPPEAPGSAPVPQTIHFKPSSRASSFTGSTTGAPVPDVMTSREWMPLNTLGKQPLDSTPYSAAILFGTGSDESSNNTTTEIKDNEQALADLPKPRTRTDWDNLFYSQLNMPSPPSRSALEEQRMMSIGSFVSASSNNNSNYDPFQHLKIEQESEPEAEEPLLSQLTMDDDVEAAEQTEAPEMEEEEAVPPPEPAPVKRSKRTPKTKKAAAPTPRKRKRAPRKKTEPKVKDYVEPTNKDVLLGRGGRSNHHPGNIKYRQQVAKLQEAYKHTDDKNEKTDLSQILVDYVHGYNGRFLQKDDDGWFEVLPIVARRKASQALREDPDPAKRTAKRQRFLKRRAAQQAQQQKG
jgi:outer membrane biosynthesis protein TonB